MASIVRGNKEFEDVARKVHESRDRYSDAVNDLGCMLEMQLISVVGNIQASLDDLSRQFKTLSVAPTRIHESTKDRYFMPFERNAMFHGRDVLLDQIRQTLLQSLPKRYNHRLAIHGLGGVGKTQIALEYAYRYKDSYDYVFWVHGADRSSLISGLASYAMSIQVQDQSQLDLIVSEVLKWLNNSGGWLVILDNLDDTRVARGFLPYTENGGHILITTRNSDVKRIPAEGLHIPSMSEEEAAQLLMLLSDCERDEQVEDIVRELGMLPLAIDQAAALIRRSNVRTFREIFHTSVANVFNELPILYPQSLFTTWSMSIDRLSPSAVRLAELVAFLNPDEVLIEFLEECKSALDTDLKAIVENKIAFVKASSELQSLSLIRVSDRGEKISMHRLLQLFLRQRLNDHSWMIKQVLTMTTAAFQIPPDKLELPSRLRLRRFLPQITGSAFISEYWERFVQEPISDSVAKFLYYEGQFAECMNITQAQIETRTRLLGSEDARILRLQRCLSSVYHRIPDKFPQALQLYEDTLTTQLRVLGPEHPDTLFTSHGLAVAYYDAGDISKSMDLAEKTYTARCKLLGPKHSQTLSTKYWVGMFCSKRGQLEKAKTILEECMRDTLEVLGPMNNDFIRCLECLAIVYMQSGNDSEGHSMYQQALAIHTQVFGEEHTRTLWLKENLERWEAQNEYL
jgi:tetratricopeptide (TPR) repeat protein